VVGCLNFCCDPHKGASQRLLGRSEQHLALNLGVIGSPGVEDDLVPLATILQVVKVVNTPSAMTLREILEEIIVVAIPLLLDDDFVVIFVEVIDDVLVLVTELEFLEDGNALIADGDTRCHGYI